MEEPISSSDDSTVEPSSSEKEITWNGIGSERWEGTRNKGKEGNRERKREG